MCRSQNLFKSVGFCAKGGKKHNLFPANHDARGKGNLQTAKGWQLSQGNQGVCLHLHQTLSPPEHREYL